MNFSLFHNIFIVKHLLVQLNYRCNTRT